MFQQNFIRVVVICNRVLGALGAFATTAKKTMNGQCNENRDLKIGRRDELGRLPEVNLDRKSTRLNSSHVRTSRMPSSA